MINVKKVKSCFLIDDDEDDREIFCDVMNQYYKNIDCITATGCGNAFDVLEKQKHNPDIIFLDLNMPEKNGKQCLSALKSNTLYKDIPVIIYSTSAQQKDISDTEKLGAAGYISKQTDVKQLASVLEDILR